VGEGGDTRARCLCSSSPFQLRLPPPLSRVGGGSHQPARGHWKDVIMHVAPIGRRCGGAVDVDMRVWAFDLTSVFTTSLPPSHGKYFET
jgi:hypothetical protein